MTATLHRILLALALVGNVVAFAGVDPVARALTAVVALLLVLDMRSLPRVPQLHLAAIAGLGGLVLLQLAPLPASVRTLLQPGFSEVLAPGWAALSLAPWATVWEAAAWVVAFILALTAARMAATRSGLPALLVTIAAAGAVAAILGLLSEGADPSRVLGLRDNVQGGSVYGPFVNRNHFAQAMELTLPAAAALLIAAARRLPAPGLERQRAAVTVIGAGVAIVISGAALIRTGSRGGALFMAVAALATLPWWRRSIGGGRRLVKLVAAAAVLAVVATLSWTRVPDVRERLSDLLVVEGVEGNTRVDLWRGTLASWRRAPVIGTGLGTYRWVIGMDKPATGAMVLEQAHNDWLEWLSTTGILGAGVLLAAILGLARLLWPPAVRRFRSELRYPLAAATLALTATALHELVGFGLQTPVNRYLVAVWVGLAWGLWERVRQLEEERARGGAAAGSAKRVEHNQEVS